MKKSDKINELKIRRLLRKPLVVTMLYLTFILSFSYVGSKTIWGNYYIWEIPSLALGAASGLSVAALASILTGIILASSHTKRKLSVWWLAFVRHGNVSRSLLAFTVILIVAAAVIPTRNSPIMDLLSDLSKKRNDQGQFIEKWDYLNQYKKYNQDEDFLLLKKIYEYRQIKQWRPHEYENWANFFSANQKNSNPRISAWTKILTADCLDRINQNNKAFEIYKEVSASEANDDYVKWWSYQEIGNYMYFEKRYPEAILSWKKATTFINSPGLNQNIASAYEDLKEFSTADEYYRKALDALRENMSKNNNIALGENSASLYVNWGNMYRLWAKEPSSDKADSGKNYLNTAKLYLNKAQKEDPSYLDAYWSMVRLHIKLNEFNLARWTIEKAIFVLNNASYYELNRFNYSLLGKKYAAYLSLLVDFYDPDMAAPSESTLQLANELIGWKFGREKSLEDFFQAAKDSSLNLTDEYKLLENNEFVDFINGKNPNKAFQRTSR